MAAPPDRSVASYPPDDDVHALLVSAYRTRSGTLGESSSTIFSERRLEFPLSVFVALPAEGAKVDTRRLPEPNLIIDRHAGLVIVLVRCRDLPATRRDLERQAIPMAPECTIPAAGEASARISDAIMSARKQELAPLFARHLAKVNYDVELHLRARALHAIHHQNTDWPDRLDDWTEAMLVRHFPRLNGIRRKLIEFLMLMVKDLDFGWGSDWPFMRAIRCLQEIYRMDRFTAGFRRIVSEFEPFIRGRASDRMITTETQEEYSSLVRRAIEYMRERYLESIGLAEVAKHLEVSGPYLSRSFHRETKVTLTEYLQKIRVQHARELLATTDDSVQEISVSCGFQSSKHFHRTFRKHCGMTPGDFRRSRRT